MLSTYRYHLSRRVDLLDGPRFCFIGVNPSTATDDAEDATTRKWNGFVSRWGGSTYEVVNLFAFRATDVRLLQHAEDPVGPDNDDWILRTIRKADVVVPCWGAAAKLPWRLRGRIKEVEAMLALGHSNPTRCLGRTADGQPRHPLMLSYETQLEEFF